MAVRLLATFSLSPSRRIGVWKQSDGTYRALEEQRTTRDRWRATVHGWTHDCPDADDARTAAHERATLLRAALATEPVADAHRPPAAGAAH